MLAHRDWITPVLGGQPWLEKPPLYYWQAMLSYSLFGVTDWAARLPSGVDATLLVLGMYFFLRRFRRGYELDGALIAASTAAVIGLSRAAATDMPLAASFSLAMLAWWAWRESGSRVFLAAFYALAALATLAKGPVAPVLAGAVIAIYALAARDARSFWRTLWVPGILLFVAVAAPWYVLVQMRNPGFFETFFVEHNLERFSSNLYHHPQPFWFYVPVLLLAVMPWTVFAVAALVRTWRIWWSERMWMRPDAGAAAPENGLALFACIWMLVPVVFFSLSKSKLPDYILPGVPAVGVLLAEYIRQNVEELDNPRPPRVLLVLHGLVASSPLFAALLIQFLVRQHRVPHDKVALVALAITLVVALIVVAMLSGRLGVRGLRFATLIPVALALGTALKLGGAALDETISSRTLAAEIASRQPRPMLLAIQGVRREIDYGLEFYRNESPVHLDTDPVPTGEFLLVVRQDSPVAIAGRRAVLLGSYEPQQVDYYWVLPAQSVAQHP